MLNVSMIEIQAAIRNALVLLLVFAMTASIGRAEVFRPLQILLPGNLSGHIGRIDRDLKLEPDLCWRLPTQLNTFRNLKDKNCLVIAPGNDSCIYSPLDYLFRGRIERELISTCRPDTQGLSPDDLEMFANSGLDRNLKQRVWTNHETLDRQTIFTPFTTHFVGNQKVWYFNFISPALCRNLPLHNWGNFEADSPQRSLRRLSPDFTETDITISTVYLNSNEIRQLASELKRMPGWHLIIQVASEKIPALFSTDVPQQEDNLWFMTIRDGSLQLPQINIFRRNQGYPRLNLRHLSLNGVDSREAEAKFDRVKDQIKQVMVTPLRVIRPAFQASSSAFCFSGKLHAILVKMACSSDVAFLQIPPTQHLVDNVICTGHILAVMENDRIHCFRITGNELLDLATAMVKNSDTIPAAFAGCEITWFAGRISSLKIAGQPCMNDRHYLVSTTERTLSDPALQKLPFYNKMRGYEGMTLWQAWLNTLKSVRMTDEQLTE